LALNITIDGYVYDGTGSICDGTVAYQAYFYGTAGSSPSKWNNIRVVDSGPAAGYYNCNLGDGDWLSQEGTAKSGDVIVIVFWNPATADRMDACSYLNEWSCFRIILDGSSTYSNNVQVRPNICPNLNWALAPNALVADSVTAFNTSTDTHQWQFSGNTMYHRNSWYTTLMNINLVDNSDYDWGDGHQDNNVAGTANRSHTWTASGDYDIEIVIEDACGCTVTGTDQIRIFNRPPVPDITMTPANPLPNEPVSFQYTGTDLDDTITNIAWNISDNGSYGSTDTLSPTHARDDVVPHTAGEGTDWYLETPNSGSFTNPGSHPVTLVISWWDGFTTQTMNYNESFTQGRFSGPAINFMQDPAEAEKDSQIEFENLSTDTDRVGLGLPDHFEYTWVWTDGTNEETIADKPFGYELIKTPTTASCKVELCAQWSDGWDTHNECLEKDVVFKTTVTVSEEDCYYNLNLIGTSDDGSVSGYGWTVYSGVDNSGPWTEQWSSPQGMEQNDKKICFATLGWYKIVGTVYGTGASTMDEEIMQITQVCPDAPPPDVVPVCPPDISGREVRPRKRVRARELKPGLRGRMNIQPSARVIHGQKVEGKSPFPGPKNI
jgi:hypothetical protein